jgi:hypothetical protein
MRSPGLLVLVLLSSPVAVSAPRLEPGCWKALTQPNAHWLLAERTPAASSKPAIKTEPSVPTVDTLLVAGNNGIREVDLAGKVMRTITKTVAREACLLPKREGVLFIGPDDNLWTVMLANGFEKRVAKLPKTVKACEETFERPKGQTFPIGWFHVELDGRFDVDKSGDMACLSLWNEGELLGVDILVDLKTGKVTSNAMSCNRKKSIELACRSTHWFAFPPAPVDRTKHPYAISEEGDLVRWGPAAQTTRIVTLGDGDFRESSASPSGTWVAITGNEMEGDFIHNEVFLLNRTDGRIWPIVETDPVPLTHEQMTDLAKHDVKTMDVVGDAIHWIPGHDLLLIGRGYLVTPGKAAIPLQGTVVF